MRGFKYVLIAAAAFSCLAVAPNVEPSAEAQVSIGIGIGGPPLCPYGYYGYGSYRCAPYGYYGPEWFNNGAFIGAGRWYHGGPGFYGHVNRSYDPRYGYRGGYPQHGGYREPSDHFQNFHASHMSDPRGHYQGGGNRGGGNRGGGNRGGGGHGGGHPGGGSHGGGHGGGGHH